MCSSCCNICRNATSSSFSRWSNMSCLAQGLPVAAWQTFSSNFSSCFGICFSSSFCNSISNSNWCNNCCSACCCWDVCSSWRSCASNSRYRWLGSAFSELGGAKRASSWSSWSPDAFGVAACFGRKRAASSSCSCLFCFSNSSCWLSKEREESCSQIVAGAPVEVLCSSSLALPTWLLWSPWPRARSKCFGGGSAGGFGRFAKSLSINCRSSSCTESKIWRDWSGVSLINVKSKSSGAPLSPARTFHKEASPSNWRWRCCCAHWQISAKVSASLSIAEPSW